MFGARFANSQSGDHHVPVPSNKSICDVTRAQDMVVVEVARENASEVPFASTITWSNKANRAYQPRTVRVLPRAARSGLHLVDAQTLNAVPKCLAVRSVVVAEQEPRSRVIRECRTPVRSAGYRRMKVATMCVCFSSLARVITILTVDSSVSCVNTRTVTGRGACFWSFDGDSESSWPSV